VKQKSRVLIGFLSVIALGLLLVVAGRVNAQIVSGNLAGTVLDPSGAVVPLASVTAANTQTGQKYTTEANQQGEYRFTNLPVGTYNVSASAASFATTTVANFPIQLNKTASLQITLQVKTMAATVEVSAASVSLDTTSAQVTNDFTSQELANLPAATMGSGVLNLSLLGAGVETSGGVGVGSGPAIGGQRPRNNNFTIEGVDNNDTSVTGPLVKVPNDDVAEFSVLQNQVSTEFGHSSGGQFNTIIKSGTNTFHGMGYVYNENRNYDALDTLQKIAGLTTVPRFDDNRYGGNIGGPIIKNKLFFFAGFEYEPIGQAGVPGSVCAPTAAGYNTINSYPGLSATNVQQFEKYVPAGTVAGVNCPTLAFPNPGGTGTIPVPTLGLSFTSPNYNNTKRLVTSGDYDFSSKDQLRIRYIYNNFAGIDNAAQFPVFFTTIPAKYHLVAINEYHTFNPHLTNEFRLGFNRYANDFPAGNFSYPGLDSFPNLQINDLGNLQLGPDPNAPQYGVQNTYQIGDTMTWVKGTHTLAFGVDARRLIAPSSFTQRSRGDYEYTQLLFFLQDKLPDYLAERSGGNSIFEGNRTAFAWFANDTWKIRPNFTANFGVRYEYLGTPYSYSLQKLNAIANVPGLITFDAPRAPKDDFGPRVGFAYSPGSSGRTVIRAGAGISYDVTFDNIGLLSLPPELTSTIDCAPVGLYNCPSPFLAGGGIPPGKGGITTFPDQASAAAATSAYIPVNQKYPKAIDWTLGVQHSFGSDFTVELRYLGTRGYHLVTENVRNIQPLTNSTVFLPTYTSNPGQATLNALPYDLNGIFNGAYGNGDGVVPAFEQGGFFNNFMFWWPPWGASTYHGLALQVNKRMSHGLMMIGSYTYSHTIDNSTADVFSTVLEPRRPQNSLDLAADRSNSILDHRHRLTLGIVYNTQFFKEGNWLEKNVLGNWQLAPMYTFQSGQWVTAQSGIDSNLNFDSAGDRTILNASGVPGTGTGVVPLCNSTVATCPATVSDAYANPAGVVGYLAVNPNAQYIQAGYGAKATVGRNTLQLDPINDIDISVSKFIDLTERVHLQFGMQTTNLFNHPQWVGGYLNDIAPIGYTGTERSMLEPQDSRFNQPQTVFSSNPRSMQLSLKVSF
jgi:Carboxypeptidase regulatory-like domain